MYMEHAHAIGTRRKKSHAIEKKSTGVKSQKKVYAPVSLSWKWMGSHGALARHGATYLSASYS